MDNVGVLVDQAKAGDEAAWEALVRLHQQMLERVARQHRLASHGVADVVQNTWMLCFRHLGNLRDPECLPAWLITTCRRESIRQMRERRRHLSLDESLSGGAAAQDPHGDPIDWVQQQDLAVRLHRILAELPSRQKLVMRGLMRHGHEGYAQASRQLGIPVGSLGPTRNRALQRLRADTRVRALAGLEAKAK